MTGGWGKLWGAIAKPLDVNARHVEILMPDM